MSEILWFVTLEIFGFALNLLVLDLFYSLLTSFLTASILIWASTLIAISFNLSPNPIFVILILMAISTLLVFKRARENWIRHLKRKLTKREFLFVVGSAISYLVFYRITPTPLAWDARSIWLFHSEWIGKNGLYSIPQRNEAFRFSHPDYPIGVPSVIGTAWKIGISKFDYAFGIRNTVLMHFFLLQNLVWQVCKKFVKIHSAVFVGSMLLLWPVFLDLGNAENYLSGYMDPLLAINVGLVLLLCIDFRRTDSADSATAFLLFIFTMTLASLKQEGLPYLAIIVFVHFVVFTVHRTRQFMKIDLFWVPALVLALCWILTNYFHGVPNTSDAGGAIKKIQEIFHFDSTAWKIEQHIQTSEPHSGLPIGFTWVIFISFGIFLFRRNFEFLQYALTLITIQILIFLTYCLGSTRKDIDWWLATSFVRVSYTPRVLVLLFPILLITYGVELVTSRTLKLNSHGNKSRRSKR